MLDKPNLVYISDKDYFLLDGRHVLRSEGAKWTLWAKSYPSQDLDAIDSYLKVLRSSGIKSRDLKPKTASIADIADVLYESCPPLTFRWLSLIQGTNYLFRHIESGQGNELVKLNESNFDAFFASLMVIPKDYKTLNDYFYSSTELAGLKKRPSFKDFCKVIYTKFAEDKKYQLLQFPVLLSADPSEPCFKYVDPNLPVAGPTPAWDEFLNRLDFPEIFLAWIWTLFDPINEGRQALWIQGNGHDGKSTIMRAIMRIYGEQYVASLTQGTIDSNFFFSQVYGKRFVVYGDCTSERIISMGKIQSLTGGDNIPVEFKGETPFNAKIYGRLMICSNGHPSIDFSKANEKSRILRIVVHKKAVGYEGDPDWENKLVAEAPAILFKAREAYAKHVPTRMNIKIPPDLFDSMYAECASEESDLVEEFIQECLIFDENEFVPTFALDTKIQDFVGNKGMTNKYKFIKDNFLKVVGKKGIKKGRRYVDDKRLRVYNGIKFKKGT